MKKTMRNYGIQLSMAALSAITLLTPSSQALASYAERLANGETIPAPAGNINKTMPPLPESTQKRHESGIQAMGGDKEAYFAKRLQLVLNRFNSKYESNKFSLRYEIKRVAHLYDIEPVSVLAAIVGEHVFNVDVQDDMQVYSVRLGMWTGFFKGEHPFAPVTECDELRVCQNQPNDFLKWACYDYQWDNKMRGRKACGGKSFPNGSIMMTYFNPMLAGRTYGLGQLGPMKVLAVADLVAERSGLPRVSIQKVDSVYAATLNPHLTLHYIAASIYRSIEVYHSVAQIDISGNHGIIATLYNLGKERARADDLMRRNRQALQRGAPIFMPQENYYGWLINTRINELQNYLR